MSEWGIRLAVILAVLLSGCDASFDYELVVDAPRASWYEVRVDGEVVAERNEQGAFVVRRHFGSYDEAKRAVLLVSTVALEDETTLSTLHVSPGACATHCATNCAHLEPLERERVGVSIVDVGQLVPGSAIDCWGNGQQQSLIVDFRF